MPTLPAVRQFITSSGVRIYRIPCQVYDNLTARVYLVLGGGPVTLVDTGSGSGKSTAQLLAGFEGVRNEFGESVGPGDVQQILMTHGHLDHVGGLADLLGMCDAEVGIHPLESKNVAAPAEWSVVRKQRVRAFLQEAGVDGSRQRELLDASRFTRDRRPGVPVALTLDDGRQLGALRAIHTPGHSPGHVCLAIDDVLLSGDHVLARTVPQQWPDRVIAYTGLGHYLDSLDKLSRAGEFRLALAGHEPVIEDLHSRIEAIHRSQARRLERLTAILDRAARPLSIGEMAPAMYGQVPGFFAMLALMDVGARVEYLHQRGQLAVANLDDVQTEAAPVFRYQLT